MAILKKTPVIGATNLNSGIIIPSGSIPMGSISSTVSTPYFGGGGSTLLYTHPALEPEVKLNLALNLVAYGKLSKIKRDLVDKLIDKALSSTGTSFQLAVDTLKANGLLEEPATVMRQSKIAKITDGANESNRG